MLIDIATALPPFMVSQTKAASELKNRMADRPATARMIDMAAVHSGISTRYVVVPDAEDLSEEKFYAKEAPTPGTKKRMQEYEKWSKELTSKAVGDLLQKTNFSPSAISRLITISCTGFFAPGLDYHLMKTFGIPACTKRTNIGFMGCAASIIGFTSVLEAMNSAPKGQAPATLLVSVELCSIHLQTESTRDNILSNIIFADGCAAALFADASEASITPRLDLLSTRSVLFDNSAEIMGWKIGDFGFEMVLSSELPGIILKQAAPALLKIIDEMGLEKDKIRHWALHPGGRAILDAMQTGVGLSDEDMKASRHVLKNYGNMSSASILFVMKELLKTNIGKGDILCAVAFGPGLTMEVAFFKGA
ncbi:MAG: type III polyketide synthase [Ignavibacteria bacterium]|jgi:predicted naringenin-chalcone synthase|nr:type III polyketide synthase [Ignavibacteria bacterium]MCU7502053.1 type III polyketide synthase [Ignavibacteria bacterium]MCU7515455.1 type III polyketide synthase [Ignavibacteria bacterium]